MIIQSNGSPRCETCNYRLGAACHRFPPGLLANQVRVWPTVDDMDVCGEHPDFRIPFDSELVEFEDDRPTWWLGVLLASVIVFSLYALLRAVFS